MIELGHGLPFGLRSGSVEVEVELELVELEVELEVEGRFSK
ncbi:hypothetical protein [Streptomyces mirabilis]